MIDLWRGSLVVAVAFLGAAVATASVLWWAGLLPSLALSENAGEYCNVLKVPVYGTIVTIRPASSFAQAPSEDDPGLFPAPDTAFSISTEIEEMLRSARADPSIKALLVDVESGGGVAVAGTEIASAIRRFGKPSAAADVVFASENSAVGSIGVSSSYTDISEKNRREGVTFHQLSSAPYKDTYNPDKPLTDAERALIMRDVNVSHDNFVRAVALYRGMPVESVAAFADGSTLPGQAALDAGLIDEIGGTEEALGYLEQAIGEPPAVCR